MFFPYLELAASLFILLLAFQIWTRHYEDRLARFFSLFAALAFLAAILTYSMRIAFTLELARDLNRLSATLWAFVFALYAHFALLFSKKKKFLSNPASYALLYLPPALLGALFLFTDLMYARYEIWNIGIVSVPAPLYSLFTLQVAGCCVWGIILLFNYARHTPQKTERQQALLIVVGSLVPLVVGIINDMVVPAVTGSRATPPTVIFDVALMNLFIFIAMRRYSLFAISPALAADIIIETMPDSLLVTDLEGRVLFLNDEAHKFFHADKDKIVGSQIDKLFVDKSKYAKIYEEVVSNNLEIERFAAELIDPLGEEIPSLINANKVKDSFGATMGVVYVIRDVRG